MNATSLPDHAEPRAASWSDRLLRKRLLATLGQLRDGQLQLHEGGTVTTLGTATGAESLQTQLRVIDPGFIARLRSTAASVRASRIWMGSGSATTWWR